MVFSSDNGYSYGAHRIPEKIVPYEESIRIPLVISGPGITPGSTDAFAVNIDIAPTFLDLANQPHDDLDGRSLVPLLDNSAPSAWRSDFLIEFEGVYRGDTGPGRPLISLEDVTEQLESEREVASPTYRAVRTSQHLYVQWYGGARHEYELYDLTEDPDQLHNLVATPEDARALAATTSALQDRLERLEGCRAESCRD